MNGRAPAVECLAPAGSDRPVRRTSRAAARLIRRPFITQPEFLLANLEARNLAVSRAR
jgi:hypothetical protein